jgi:hypothetical protein
MHINSTLHSLLLLSIPLLLSVGCETVPSYLHVGQRLLHFEILVDEHIQLSGLRGVNDNMPVHQMWNVLADVTFTPVAKETRTDAPNQTIVTYQGKVVIRFRHVDNVLDSISTESLTLSRSQATDFWSLNQGEFDRLKNLANGNKK